MPGRKQRRDPGDVLPAVRSARTGLAGRAAAQEVERALTTHCRLSASSTPGLRSMYAPWHRDECVSGRGVIAGRWTVQHGGQVLEQLQSAVEGVALDHLESNVGPPVVDPFAPSDARD